MSNHERSVRVATIREVLNAQSNALWPALVSSAVLGSVVLVVRATDSNEHVPWLAALSLGASLVARALLGRTIRRALSPADSEAELERLLRLTRLEALLGGFGWAPLLVTLHVPEAGPDVTAVLCVTALTIGAVAARMTDGIALRLFVWPYVAAASTSAAIFAGNWSAAIFYVLVGTFAHLSSGRYQEWFNQRVTALELASKRQEQLEEIATRERRLRGALQHKSRKLELLVNKLQLGFWEMDLPTRRVRVSRTWRAITRVKCQSVRRWTTVDIVLDALHPDDRSPWLQTIEAVASGKAPEESIEVRLREGDRWVTDLVRVKTFETHGTPLRLVGVRRDSTERARSEYRAQQLELRMTKLTNQLPGFVFEFEKDRNQSARFIFTSDGVEKLYGISAQAATKDPASLYARLHPDDRALIEKRMQQAALDGSVVDLEYRVRGPDDAYRWLSMHASTDRQADGSVKWYGLVWDAEPQIRHRRELWLQGRTDPLTGLGNRRALLEAVNRSFELIRRPVELYSLRLGQLTKVNQSLEYHAGDELLCLVA